MKHYILFILFILLGANTVQAQELIVKKSNHNVSQTAEKFVHILKEKGLTLFARIDHAEGAQKTGLVLKPSQLIIFGNPKMGTPLMQSNPQMGLDLPLKILIYEANDGDTYLSYVKPEALKTRHHILDHDELFIKMTDALEKMSSLATQ